MPNTTNFNWSTPADTDLVKNGASAIRTLGSAIDTSFVDFKGGTTGQVLKKTSNTDLDVEWGTVSSGLILINTTSFSAVASQSVNDVFSSTYDNYRIVCEFSSSTDQEVFFRLRASGSDLTSNVYRIGQLNIGVGISGTFGSVNNTLTTQLTIVNNGNSFSSGFVADIIAPNKAQAKFYNGQSTGRLGYWVISQIQQATAYTGYTISCTAATTLSGTISTYGYSK
jgi:hypothetical protein